MEAERAQSVATRGGSHGSHDRSEQAKTVALDQSW
jgi:hypothetical protein